MYYLFSEKSFAKVALSLLLFCMLSHREKKKSHCNEIRRHKSIFKSSDEQFKAENILKRQATLSQTIA